MPWKECHVMDERLRFVARLLEGEKMARLCAEFGISRKTGYKIFDRYKDCGVGAFNDRSRRPHRQANRLPPQLEAVIVRLKREYPGWGAPKIREHDREASCNRGSRAAKINEPSDTLLHCRNQSAWRAMGPTMPTVGQPLRKMNPRVQAPP